MSKRRAKVGGIRAVRRNMLLTGIGAAAFLGELVFLKKMDLTLQQEVYFVCGDLYDNRSWCGGKDCAEFL